MLQLWALRFSARCPRAARFFIIREIYKLLFEIKKGGVGYPMIKHPHGYKNIEKHRPNIEYIDSIDLKNII